MASKQLNFISNKQDQHQLPGTNKAQPQIRQTT
jgi:hypothetical protein